MKTKLFFLATVAFSLFCKAQNVTIPDAIFKSYLVNNSAINTNGDSQIQVSEAIAFTGTIDCSTRSIASLTGIEAFVNLKKLSCFGNLLTSLDLTKNTALTSIICSGNQLATLDVTKNLALTELNFHTNQIANIDVSKNTLLTELTFTNNFLTSIDLTKNTALSSLICDNNLLTSLDLSKNTVLKFLDCSTNKLTTLNVNNNKSLEQLSLSSNSLASLDLTSNTALWNLNSLANDFTTIDLSKNTALLNVDFSNSKLTGLDVSSNKDLQIVVVSNSKLTSANLKNGNNAGIFYLDITGNPDLTCIQVDNVDDANSYTTLESWIKDETSTYNTNCGSTLGINDISKDRVKIFPNPTKSLLKWAVTADVEVYNTVGQKILTINNTSSADISKLSNGIYLVVLKDKNGKEIQRSKIIKN